MSKLDAFLLGRGWEEGEIAVMSPLVKQQLYYQDVTSRMGLIETPGYRRIVEKINSQTQLSLDDIPDGIYTCRCGSEKTTYIQRQTRRADEGMTTIIRCHQCGRQWRD